MLEVTAPSQISVRFVLFGFARPVLARVPCVVMVLAVKALARSSYYRAALVCTWQRAPLSGPSDMAETGTTTAKTAGPKMTKPTIIPVTLPYSPDPMLPSNDRYTAIRTRQLGARSRGHEVYATMNALVVVRRGKWGHHQQT